MSGRSFLITHQIVTHGDQACTEIVGVHHAVSLLQVKNNSESPCIRSDVNVDVHLTDPVEVVEGGSELIELLLADALGVAGQDLVLHLVDGASDGGEQLLPAHTDVLEEGMTDDARNRAIVNCCWLLNIHHSFHNAYCSVCNVYLLCKLCLMGLFLGKALYKKKTLDYY